VATVNKHYNICILLLTSFPNQSKYAILQMTGITRWSTL